jgi:hypothetical protein
MRRIHLHFTDPQLARLRALADRSGLNVAELVRRALDDYLRREDGGAAARPTQPVDGPGPSPEAPAERSIHAKINPQQAG